MKVLIAAAIFGISCGMYGCSNEAKFAGRPMAATEAPEAPASSPGAAIQSTADANPSGVTSTGATITTTTGTTAGTTTIVTGNTSGATTTGTTTVATMGTLPVVPLNWVDVTTTNGTTPSTCNATPANCTMKDTISGLKWSNSRPYATWQGAIDHCRSLNYNGVTGWHLPTKEELFTAKANGIDGAAKVGWITANAMLNSFWSSSSVSYNTTDASLVILTNNWYTGLNELTNVKFGSHPVVCVQ